MNVYGDMEVSMHTFSDLEMRQNGSLSFTCSHFHSLHPLLIQNIWLNIK